MYLSFGSPRRMTFFTSHTWGTTVKGKRIEYRDRERTIWSWRITSMNTNGARDLWKVIVDKREQPWRNQEKSLWSSDPNRRVVCRWELRRTREGPRDERGRSWPITEGQKVPVRVRGWRSLPEETGERKMRHQVRLRTRVSYMV